MLGTNLNLRILIRTTLTVLKVQRNRVSSAVTKNFRQSLIAARTNSVGVRDTYKLPAVVQARFLNSFVHFYKLRGAGRRCHH